MCSIDRASYPFRNLRGEMGPVQGRSYPISYENETLKILILSSSIDFS